MFCVILEGNVGEHQELSVGQKKRGFLCVSIFEFQWLVSSVQHLILTCQTAYIIFILRCAQRCPHPPPPPQLQKSVSSL